MDTKYKGRKNMYLFTWEGHKVAMVPIKDSSNKPKASRVNGQSFLTVASF